MLKNVLNSILRKPLFVVAFLGIAVFNQGCFFSGKISGLPSILESGPSSQNPESDSPLPTVYSPLVASKVNLSMTTGYQAQTDLPTKISGGVPPYSYAIVAGPGEINSVTGIYKQALSWQPTTIRVTDSVGQTVDLTLNSSPQFVDNYVNAMAIDGNSLFIGGDFTRTFPNMNSYYAILDPTTGNLASHLCNYKGKFSGGSYLNDSLLFGDELFLIGDFTGAKFGEDEVASSIIKINLTSCELDIEFNEKAKTMLGQGITATVDADTKSLYVGGDITSYDGNTVSHLIKIDLNTGVLDTNFSQASGIVGIVGNVPVKSLVLSGASLFVGGNFLTYRGLPAKRLAKIDKLTGTLDTIFTQSTGVVASDVNQLLVTNGSLYVAVSKSISVTYRGAVAPELMKLDLISGNMDTTFSQVGFGFPNRVFSVATDGTSLYVGGEFNTYRGVACPRAIKIDPNSGVMDTGFVWGTGATGGSAFYFKYDSIGDGLYLITDGQTYNGTATDGFLKINKLNGQPAPGFNYAVASVTTDDLEFMPDGKIIASFSGIAYSGTPSNRLAKLNLDTFNFDPAFDIGTGFNGAVYAVLVQGNYVYVGGDFSTYNGQPAIRLAKIDKNTGVLDTTFTQATGFDVLMFPTSVASLATDGTALFVCGSFGQYRGVTVGALARILLSNGNLDTTFTQTTGLNNYCNSVIYHNSSVYVSGMFTTYRGVSANYLAKIHPTTGVLDTTFTVSGSGLNAQGGNILGMGSSIYVSGSFTSYRGSPAANLIKVDQNSGIPDMTFTQTTGANTPTQILGALNQQLFVSFFSGKTFVGAYSQVAALTDYRSDSVNNFIAVSTTDSALNLDYRTSSGPDNIVSSVKSYSTFLILAGRFTNYRGSPAKYLTFIDPVSGNKL